MTSIDNPPEPPAAASPPRPSQLRERMATLFEWLTRRAAIKKAAAESKLSAEMAGALTRGQKALWAGERLLDPPDGSRREYDLGLAMFRESAYWLTLAGAAQTVPEGSLRERLAVMAEAEPASLGAWVTANPLPAALDESAVAFSVRTVQEQLSAASAAQRWASALLAAVERRHGALTTLRRERALRLGVFAVPLGALLFFAAFAAFTAIRGPDLAAGKPWRTSSSQDVCYPAKGLCLGAVTYIFFSTREETNPWYEVDLLSPKRVRRVEIVNRRDTAQDKALPLVIEVSTDGQRYFQVARRTDPFSEWNADFQPVEARYVRVSVARSSTLHLERVSVR